MKMKHNRIIIISVYIIIIIVSHVFNDNFKETKANGKIANPIINIEKDNEIKTQIFENSYPIEYNFCINNYIDEKINEVEFEYYIQIILSNSNFPVKYELFDCENNKYIKLSNGKSEVIKLKAFEKQSQKFKLYFNWKEMEGELAENVKINLKIIAKQSRGEVL